jgi:tRNA dimethylallyltransferase
MAPDGGSGAPPTQAVIEAALIVAGPTCSGKSRLAIALAQHLGGTIINADSMQIYRELRVLTARPSPVEEALVPHALYGVLPASQRGSVGWWRAVALEAMRTAGARGRVPILCGGTGLYFEAISGGLADVPDPGMAARTEARLLLLELGAKTLYRRLALVDPETAERLRPEDGQRVARAWEVLRGTGSGLAYWHARSKRGPAGLPSGWRFTAVLLDPPRDRLWMAIEGRFANMVGAGALEEVRRLAALGLDASLPAMRALGVPQLAAHIRGEITIEEAAQFVCAATRQYAKRQRTWFRHHKLAEPEQTHTIHAQYAGHAQCLERIIVALENFVRLPG